MAPELEAQTSELRRNGVVWTTAGSGAEWADRPTP
jgi:hypothetical protein